MAIGICAVDDCVACPTDHGTGLCTIHENITRRKKGDAAICCYACGRRIRICGQWLVRAEGAFHLRAECLNKHETEFKIAIRRDTPSAASAAGSM